MFIGMERGNEYMFTCVLVIFSIGIEYYDYVSL